MKKWRIIPKVAFVNYRKRFPGISAQAFGQLFYIRSAWSGRLVFVGVKHFAIEFDFRRNWLAELMDK